MYFAKIVGDLVEWVEQHEDCRLLSHLINKLHGSAPIPDDTRYVSIPDSVGPACVAAVPSKRSPSDQPSTTVRELQEIVSTTLAQAAQAASNANSDQSTSVNVMGTPASAEPQAKTWKSNIDLLKEHDSGKPEGQLDADAETNRDGGDASGGEGSKPSDTGETHQA